MDTTITQAPVARNSPSPRPVYTRLAAFGFGLVALGALVALAIALAAGDLGELSFILPIVIVGLLIAGALLRFGVWAQVVAALLAFALLALFVPFTIFQLLHPESASDFIPSLLFGIGAVFGFVGAVVGLFQRRRHTLRAVATPAEALLLKGIMAVVALLVAFSLVSTAMARTSVSAESKAGAFNVEQKNTQFSPGQIQAKAGQTVRIVVRNDDTTLHTFTLDEAHVDVSIPPGAERLIEFKSPAAGSYQWYCIPHSDANGSTRTGMVGTLQVQ
jgi:plastocyanin